MEPLTQKPFAHDDKAPSSSRRIYGTRPVRIATLSTQLSGYEDDVWNLTPLILQEQLPGQSLQFASVPAQFRAVTRELFSALLTEEPPPGEGYLAVSTISSLFRNCRHLLSWMDRAGLLTLDTLTQPELAKYLTEVWDSGSAKGRREKAMRAIRLFHLYRTYLSVDRLNFDPRLVEGWNRPLKPRSGENLTPRIPEAVLAPLVEWAHVWVDSFADDVLGALEEYSYLRDRSSKVFVERTRGATGFADLAATLDRYVASNRKLPGYTPQDDPHLTAVNLSHLAREAGCTMDVAQRLGNERILSAVSSLGIDDATYLWFVPTALVGDRPWLDRVGLWDVPGMVENLTAACYVLIAFFSGMRDSEIKHLRRDCYRTVSDSSGAITRRIVEGLAFKGEGTPSGVVARWVVGEPVGKAIDILERLQPPDEHFLFATNRHQINRRAVWKKRIQTSGHSNDQLNRFLSWIQANSAKFATETRPEIEIPAWRLTTKQFRRTLAWFIARRPGGSIAGAIQFRHQSVQMFEGYAGTSESGFRAEVESEQALERGEFMLAAVENNEHLLLTGPSAREARDRMAGFAEQAGFQGIVAESPAQLRKLLTLNDPRVFRGAFVTCVYNPERALCGSRADRPDMTECQPLACRNVALTESNRAEWAEQLAQLDRHISRGSAVAPYVLQRLRGRRAEIVRLISEESNE